MRKTTLVLQPAPLTDVPPAPPTPTNEMLMEAVKHGDTGAFWTLYWRHAELLREAIGRSVADEEAKEELLQRVFQEISDRAAFYTPEKGRVLGWMITLARKRAIEWTSQSAAAERKPANPAAAPAPIRAASGALRWDREEDRGFSEWNPAAA